MIGSGPEPHIADFNRVSCADAQNLQDSKNDVRRGAFRHEQSRALGGRYSKPADAKFSIQIMEIGSDPERLPSQLGLLRRAISGAPARARPRALAAAITILRPTGSDVKARSRGPRRAVLPARVPAIRSARRGPARAGPRTPSASISCGACNAVEVQVRDFQGWHGVVLEQRERRAAHGSRHAERTQQSPHESRLAGTELALERNHERAPRRERSARAQCSRPRSECPSAARRGQFERGWIQTCG